MNDIQKRIREIEILMDELYLVHALIESSHTILEKHELSDSFNSTQIVLKHSYNKIAEIIDNEKSKIHKLAVKL